MAPSRRDFVKASGAVGLWAGRAGLWPSYAQSSTANAAPLAAPRRSEGAFTVVDLTIAETTIEIGGRRTQATTINGTVPGPLLRFREGAQAIIRVTNKLKEDTSLHWHGLIVPPDMDGVPGISFAGIHPRQTFEYRFALRQYGTYWYHSHSGLQEQLGTYGPLIIDPAEPHPYTFDREHFVVLSDWTFENPYRVLAKLKKHPDYYNFQQRTIFDFFGDVGKNGLMSTISDRLMWARMRMNPTDIMDVNGATYTFLMNGLAPVSNWTGLYKPGERVLLHVINASANSIFDVRIPGLPMTVVQSNGQNVQPVETDEFRIAAAETYNVIVAPPGDSPYTIFAESIDRSSYTRGTLATRHGQSAAVPPRRKRPILTMADMGMDHGGDAIAGMAGMDHSKAGGSTAMPSGSAAHAGHGGAAPEGDAKEQVKFATAGAIRTSGLRAPGTVSPAVPHDEATHGAGNAMTPATVRSRLHEPGLGLGQDGWRVLAYTDLRVLKPRPDFKPPSREIEIHLTGNMERFMWSIDGVAFENSAPIKFTFGERLRLTMVNDSMMHHPMHLHGMWMELENGHGDSIPLVHTVNVKPAERLSLLINADAPGRWAFHCHLLFHMETGMFRVVEVSEPTQDMRSPHEQMKSDQQPPQDHKEHQPKEQPPKEQPPKEQPPKEQPHHGGGHHGG